VSQVFKSELVIDGVPELLLAAEIRLRSLNRHMAKQELDLLQLSSRHVAEPRARAPEIMGCKPIDAGALRRLTTCQMAFAESRSPQILSVRITFRNT
jgi:hypothetical protein